MPQHYYASEESYRYIQQLNYGFYLDQSDSGSIAIMVKLEPGLLDSIISCCPLRLVIRNPNLLLRSCTLTWTISRATPFTPPRSSSGPRTACSRASTSAR